MPRLTNDEQDLAPTPQAQGQPQGTGSRWNDQEEPAATPETTLSTPPDYGNMPWSEVAKSALNAAPSSVEQQLGNLYTAVRHPVQTVSTLGELGTGLESKAEGWLGYKQDPQEKANTEAVINALGQHYSDQYGSVAGFKKSLATNPFSVGMDVAAAIPVVGGVTRAAGITGDLADVAGRVASTVLDPTQMALKAAQGTGKLATGVGNIATKAQSLSSGVPESLLDIAREVGKTSDPAKLATFNRFIKGQGTGNEISQTAMDSLEEAKQNASNVYLAAKGGLNAQATPSFTGILQAHQDLNNFLNYGGTSTLHRSARNLIEGKDGVNDQIQDVLNSTNPAARSITGLDNLKQSISDLAQNAPGPFKGKIGALAGEIKKAIVDVDPTYANMMDKWSDWKDQLNDYQKTLGLKDSTTTAAQMGKMMRAAKTDTGTSLLSELAGTNAGRLLPYMLAGHASNPILSNSFLSKLGSGAAAITGILHPHTIPPLLGLMASTSPRLAANLQFGVGRTQALANALTPFKPIPPIPYGLTQLGGLNKN